MKKILILGLVSFYSHISTAQSSAELVSANPDSSAVVTMSNTVEDRLNKQELDIQALKKDNELLKKQIKQVQSSQPSGRRKWTVSRVGSKQLLAQ